VSLPAFLAMTIVELNIRMSITLTNMGLLLYIGCLNGFD
jgi:hypothetical protein